LFVAFKIFAYHITLFSFQAARMSMNICICINRNYRSFISWPTSTLLCLECYNRP